MRKGEREAWKREEERTGSRKHGRARLHGEGERARRLGARAHRPATTASPVPGFRRIRTRPAEAPRLFHCACSCRGHSSDWPPPASSHSSRRRMEMPTFLIVPPSCELQRGPVPLFAPISELPGQHRTFVSLPSVAGT